jgi:alpha-tubulin suppressor-like RCC1 family protein
MVYGRAYVFGSNLSYKLGIDQHVQNIRVPTELSYNVNTLAFGMYHGLLLMNDGELYGAGRLSDDQFGLTEAEEQQIAKEYPDSYSVSKTEYGDDYVIKDLKHFINLSKIKRFPDRIIKIAAGDGHACFLTEKGQCYFFGIIVGRHVSFSIGGEDTKTWYHLADNVVDIGCGRTHVCYLNSSGDVFSAGMNDYGQLGHIAYSAEPARIPLFDRELTEKCQRLFADDFNTLFIHNNYLYAVGSNRMNKMGLFDTDVDSNLRSPVLIVDENDKPIINVTKVATAYEHTLILADGIVYISGSNQYYQLGLPDKDDSIRKPRICQDFLSMVVTDIGCTSDASYIIANNTIYYAGYDVFKTPDTSDTKLFVYQKTFAPITFIHRGGNLELAVSGGVVGIIVREAI